MNPLTAMFIGFAVVWVGLFAYVLRLNRISRSIERELHREP
jgi:CcmD family protein